MVVLPFAADGSSRFAQPPFYTAGLALAASAPLSVCRLPLFFSKELRYVPSFSFPTNPFLPSLPNTGVPGPPAKLLFLPTALFLLVVP